MHQITCENWWVYRDNMAQYAGLPRTRRDEFWFRGQNDASYRLRPTVDRINTFGSDLDRQRYVDALLDEFKTEAIRITTEERFTHDIDRLELLGRHFGLPSPILDWTLSPFVAAYFALQGIPDNADWVAVWALDLAKLSLEPTSLEFELINDIEKIQVNPRALRQRAVFMRITTRGRAVEEIFGGALYKFLVPATEAERAMGELDEMMINGTNLLYDLEGVAQTAAGRVSGENHGHG